MIWSVDFSAVVTVRSIGDRKAASTTTAKNVTTKERTVAARLAGLRRARSTSMAGSGGAPTSFASLAIYFVSPA